jgi:Icc-related predicted phosphoesterase
MKTLLISDTHNQHHDLDIPNDIDMIIHAGDFSNKEDQFFEFLTWYGSLAIKYKILIAGNHDFKAEIIPTDELKKYCADLGIIYLQDSAVTIDGIKFYGSPYSNIYGNYAFMREDFELAVIWHKIPDDVQVLITHGPAYKSGDWVNNGFSSERYVGSLSLAEKIAGLPKLKYHIFGHIHESYGIHQEKNHIAINAALFNFIERLNDPIVIEL